MIPIDILPVFKSPGGADADVLRRHAGRRASRRTSPTGWSGWTGQANGTARQESRSIVGASIVRNYFQGDVDPNGALTQVNSLALAAIPNLPPGTLPPVVLPFDPTARRPSAWSPSTATIRRTTSRSSTTSAGTRSAT